MKEILDLYNWACPEIPKKIYIKPRVQPSEDFGGRDEQFGSREMPTIDIAYDWLAKSISKPISTVEVQQAYEIDKLKGQVEFHKQSLINLEKSVSTRLNDYNNLEVDYLNSQGEVKSLLKKVEQLDGLEQYNIWLMNQYLNLKKELGK